MTSAPSGISFIVRVRNEEATLARSLASLQPLTIPHEIIVLLHLCTDSSRSIAESYSSTRVFEYDKAVSRSGYETLITPDSSDHSIIRYNNWCFAKARHLWCFKWDADFVATDGLIRFLNERGWDDETPTRIRIPAVPPVGKPNLEPYLYNAGQTYAKYVFWKHNKDIFLPHVREEKCSREIIHDSTLADIKSYWRDEPWFERHDSAEAIWLRQRYKVLVERYGAEPIGMARAGNPAGKNIYHRVRSDEAELRGHGINLWK